MLERFFPSNWLRSITVPSLCLPLPIAGRRLTIAGSYLPDARRRRRRSGTTDEARSRPNPTGLIHFRSAIYRRNHGKRTRRGYPLCFHKFKLEKRPVFEEMYVSALRPIADSVGTGGMDGWNAKGRHGTAATEVHSQTKLGCTWKSTLIQNFSRSSAQRVPMGRRAAARPAHSAIADRQSSRGRTSAPGVP